MAPAFIMAIVCGGVAVLAALTSSALYRWARGWLEGWYAGYNILFSLAVVISVVVAVLTLIYHATGLQVTGK